jgi:hypothetical protein
MAMAPPSVTPSKEFEAASPEVRKKITDTMQGFFGGNAQMPAAPPPPPPTPEDPAVQSQMDEASRRAKKGKGRLATMLTGGRGLMGRASVVRRTLLGV